MEKNYTQLTGQVGDFLLPVVIAAGALWFTQKTIGCLLGLTKQAVSSHLQEFDYNSQSSGAKEFQVAQSEGKRVITRRLKHYSLATAYAVANAARRMDCMAPAIELAKQYRIAVDESFVAVRKEYQFRDLLTGLLSGIVSVKPQYRLRGYIIDFYIPELNLGIEYDEHQHELAKHKALDILRQNKLQQSTGVRFIRIRQGMELQGLNAILKLLLPEGEGRV